MNKTYLYVIAPNEAGPSKIGFSNDPDKRVRQLQTGCPERLSLQYVQETTLTEARRIEKSIHQTLGYLRKTGEWFDLTVSDAILEVQHGMMSERY